MEAEEIVHSNSGLFVYIRNVLMAKLTTVTLRTKPFQDSCMYYIQLKLLMAFVSNASMNNELSSSKTNV